MYWKFYLANSKDLTNIAELTQARGRSLNLVNNLPGSASFTYPMSTDYAELINPISSCIKAYRFNWRETARQRALGVKAKVWDTVWSGPVATIDEDITADRMTVNAVGWLDRLNRRDLRRDINFLYANGVSTDDAEIIFSLLGEANGYLGDGVTMQRDEYADGVNVAGLRGPTNNDWYAAYWPVGSKPNVPTWIKQGAKLPNEGPGGATAYVPAYRGKNYQNGQNIGQAITELTQIENGCDVRVDPVTRELNIYRRMRVVRDNVIFGYNWGPNNIQQLGRQIDGTNVINYHKSTGASGSIPKYQDDVTSMMDFGPLEETTALSDVVDLVVDASTSQPKQSVLWTYSAAEILIRSRPRGTFSLTPFPYTPSGGVPEPFVDYNLGDQVRFTAKWGKRVNVVNQGVRVFGLNVTIDDMGNEKLGQLQFTPGS